MRTAQSVSSRRARRSAVWCAITALAGTLAAPASADSLRFHGNGVNDIDRVKIRIDEPEKPLDVVGDMTVEFWLRAEAGQNGSDQCVDTADKTWIRGHILLDRDVFGAGDFGDWGVSLYSDALAFGVSRGTLERTICSGVDLDDGQWHHVAATRRVSDGLMRIFVDGNLSREATGPTGDISYRNGRSTSHQNDPFLVIGAEKHDANLAEFPSFRGWLDEVHVSSALRYSAAFAPPTSPIVADGDTAALYHFDEGSGTVIVDSAIGGQSTGELKFGGTPAGPERVADSPFALSPGTVQFSRATDSVGEEAGSYAPVVTRSGGTQGAASVTLSIQPGTAVEGADYTVPAVMTLNWPDGVGGSRTFSIGIVNDAQPESTETFDVLLVSATGATLGGTQSQRVSIIDNDSAGTLQFSSASFTGSESSRQAVLSVTRANGTAGPVSVNYQTSPGTAGAADFTGASGTLNWNGGEDTAKTVTVTIADDALVEGNETFTVALSTPGGGATLGAPSTATVTIADNESTQPGTLQFSAATAAGSEATGDATLTLMRTNGTDAAVSVRYQTSNGTAGGSDFAAADAVVNWASGDGAPKTITLAITDDAVVEGNETFSIALSSPTGGATLGAPSTATVTITDNDAPQPGSLQFSAAGLSGGEASAQATITVTRANGSDGAVSVRYATRPGTADAGDFTAASGVLTWNAGDATPQTITIAVTNDSAVEPAETFDVELSQPTGGATLGSPATVIVTIADNDTAPPGDTNSGGGAIDLAALLLLALRMLARRAEYGPVGVPGLGVPFAKPN